MEKIEYFLEFGKRMQLYARVPSRDQNEGRQIEQLKAEGISESNIIIDKQSGKNFDRTGYQYLINNRLSEGDVLVITSIDRLGRKYQKIMNSGSI